MTPQHRIVLVARSQEKAAAAKLAVVDELGRKASNATIIPMACDHCSLHSVREFCSALTQELESSYNPSKWGPSNGIDVLCLNAAILQAPDSDAVFTNDGFEVTFQTNHLAPFLIANLTMNMINPGGRVVFSTSELHRRHELNFDAVLDKATGEPQKGFKMMDGSDFHYKTSYAVSKLCIMAVCVAVNEKLRQRKAIATSFSPGLMTTSGLFRQQARQGQNIADVLETDALRREKTVMWGGGSLVYMALADAPGKQGAQYWRDTVSFAGSSAVYGKEFCPAPITDMDTEKRSLLWATSCHFTGIPYVSESP